MLTLQQLPLGLREGAAGARLLTRAEGQHHPGSGIQSPPSALEHGLVGEQPASGFAWPRLWACPFLALLVSADLKGRR